MDKKVAKLWVKALRSGRYHQGKDSLVEYKKDATGECTGTLKGYCCLGVLAEISKLDYLPDQGTPPRAIWKNWAGLRTSDGELPTDSPYRKYGACLAELNDGKGFGFKRIADVIERHWEAL
jgi:hypothetical protein